MVIKNIESDFCIMDREDNGDKKLKKKYYFYLCNSVSKNNLLY